MLKTKAVYRCFNCKIEKEEKAAKKMSCPICGAKMAVINKGIVNK